MSIPTESVALANKPMEYIPFGGSDKIKLSVSIVKNLIAVKTKSGKTCSDNDAVKFLMMNQARKLNPFEGDSFLIGYDGKDGPTFSLITAHQAFLKRAELNAEYDGMKSGIIVEEDGKLVDLEGDFHTPKQKPVGGWATVFFKHRSQPMHKRVRLARFQKQFGIWQDDPAGMICKCAEADALRSSFPTMLGGLYLREEIVGPEKSDKVTEPVFTEPPATTVQVMPEAEVVPVPVPTKTTSDQPRSKPQPIEPKPKPKSEPTSDVGRVELLTTRILKSGIGVQQVIDMMIENGTLDESITSLGQVIMNAPDVFEMIERQLDDIVERIKTIII